MTSAQAKRLGRLGGLRSAEVRGARASSWGYMMQAKRGSKAQRAAYPGLVKRWMEKAWKTRHGLETEPLPSVDSIKAPSSEEEPRVRVHRGATAGRGRTQGKG